MNWFAEYGQSLKQIEAEEIFDLLIYRPVAFILVKLTYPVNITPNQVSVIAMLFGILSGVLFAFGTGFYNILGAFSYLSCNILDCADGQIARLKNNGTKVGRIVDGFIDYVVSTAIYVGIGIGFMSIISTNPEFIFKFNFIGNSSLSVYIYVWLITAAGGFSSAFQAIYFDYYRNEYLEKVYSKFSSIEKEIREFREEKQKLDSEKSVSNIISRMLIVIYLKYCSLQLSLKGKQIRNAGISDVALSDIYKRKHLIPLKLCSLMGSTTHMTLCFIFAVKGDFETYLWVCILPLNLLMLVLYFNQKRINKKITSQLKH